MNRKTRATTVHIEPLPGAAAPDVSDEEKSAFKQDRARRREQGADAPPRGDEPPVPAPDASVGARKGSALAPDASAKTRKGSALALDASAKTRKGSALALNAQALSVGVSGSRARSLVLPADEPVPSSRGRGIVQRKDGEAVRHLSAYVPPGVFRELRDYAEGEGKSVSDAVCEAILLLLREVKR